MSKKISTPANLGWKGLMFALAAVLVAGTQSTVEAQCTASSCPNQVVPANPATAYQQHPYTKVRKVLLYDNAPGHTAGKLGTRRAMYALATKYGFELTINDGAIGWITAARLQDQDVVLFSQGDCDVASTPASDSALQNYIYRDGGSMLMIHAAAAFIVCPGTGTSSTCGLGGHDIAAAGCRFMARAVARQYYHHQNANSPARIYADSVFAGQTPPHQTCQASGCATVAAHTAIPPIAAINHGRRSAETRNIFINTTQFNWPLPQNSPTDARTVVWDNYADEWYEFYNNPGPRAIEPMNRQWNGQTYVEDRLNILLSMDETSRYLGSQRMGDHPLSWVRKMGRGLSAYNNIGHDNVPYSSTRSGTTAYDSISHAYLWNLIRYLGRDYQGCDDPTRPNYVPWASVRTQSPGDTDPCLPAGITTAPGEKAMLGVSAFKGGVIRVATPLEGFYRVAVSDLQGRQVYTRTIIGGAERNVEVKELSKGSYTVRVTLPSKAVDVVQVNL